MELALNILWLLLAAGGVALWRTSWARQPRTRRHASWCEWTAVACALVLLFFVVSLTDDLHPEIVALEDCTTCRRHVNCLSPAQHAPQPDHFRADSGAVLIPAQAQQADFASGALQISARQQLLPLPRQQTYSGRAPPFAI
jgi:hypothetical protein